MTDRDPTIPSDGAEGLDREAPLAADTSAGESAAEFRLSPEVILQTVRAAQREAVLAEIDRLRHEKSGWGRNLAVLGTSLALFVFLGLLANPARTLALIVAAIVIHELGHYLGMRAFGYRDVRMFFIPLFGAAVSGRGGSASGWQRATVALLGPLPGLLLGGLCSWLSARGGDQPLLREFAIVLLLLNGFNLLPFFPLDGGKLVQDVLLSRNRFLEAGFRTLCGLLFVATGFLWVPARGWVLGVFGLFALLGVPDALKFGRMAARLRPELGGLAGESALGAGDIPPEAADRLIAEVQRENPRLPDVRAVAWRVENLWERLQIRPPSWPAAVAFLAIQFLAICLAFWFWPGRPGA